MMLERKRDRFEKNIIQAKKPNSHTVIPISQWKHDLYCKPLRKKNRMQAAWNK